MRAEILVGREWRRRWSVDDKLQTVRQAFAPGARVTLVARRRDESRSQIYRWRAALREGRSGDEGGEVVGFVSVQMPMAPSVASNAPIPAIHRRRAQGDRDSPAEAEAAFYDALENEPIAA